MNTVTNSSPITDYLTLNYPITFYPEAEGGYTVVIQDLPGCISTGETLQEAMENILDAKQCWLETAIQFNDPIPFPSTFNSHSHSA
ncbi:MAG: type II toxin-antitoxin system HicB family antitoxin [Synechocystis sp.]|nr:type II toxin-antitoxin system HicB family antitoxin [Synechocystis sp.]